MGRKIIKYKIFVGRCLDSDDSTVTHIFYLRKLTFFGLKWSLMQTIKGSKDNILDLIELLEKTKLEEYCLIDISEIEPFIRDYIPTIEGKYV